MQKYTVSLLLIFFCVSITACAPTGRYYQHHDTAPTVVPHNVTTQDAIPKHEPYAPANLRPYTIRGINYQPLATGLGFTESGQASWYGEKFHGHKTSNGEIYDMYKMSAAHKTLPLPSFARITNLDNGKQVVVRVNDRGPFHRGRIVDLSYAAALKLDVLVTGTANVKLDVVHVTETGQITVGKQKPVIPTLQSKAAYIQVIALQDKVRLTQIGKKLQASYQLPFRTIFANNIHKLQLGPIPTSTNMEDLISKLKSNSYPNAYPVFM